jgi:GT2 family glycosyltransferase
MNYFFVPYSLEKNIGKAYNQYMSLLPKDDDWAILMDGDTLFLTFDWGHAVAEVIKKIPDAGIITCQTNRIRQKKQLYDESSPDILVHRLIAKTLDQKYRGQTRKINTHISGFFMAIKKKTWKEVGKFSESDGKLLTVDNAFSKKIMRAGKDIYLMRGMYVFHYYRFAEGKNYTDHEHTTGRKN